ncbi:hypothetical protein [Chitinimonas naiadis]
MNKLLAALIASAFAFVSFGAVAADAPADKPAAQKTEKKVKKHHKAVKAVKAEEKKS